MSAFKVSVVNGVLTVLCEDEIPETDIIDLLTFDESQMESLYREHAAIQSRWEQIAINLKNRWESFSEEFEKKWWAHNKRYAKLYLLGSGEKSPTIDSIKDAVISIYSFDTNEADRTKYCDIAHKYASSKDASLKNKVDFIEDMFYYALLNPSWPYEALVRTVKNLEYNYLTAQNIAKRLEARSYHMKELKDLTMAKHFNIGPVTEISKREQQSFQKMSGYVTQEVSDV